MTDREIYRLMLQRRRELAPAIRALTQDRVRSGPFTGMHIVDQHCWGDGDTLSKLLGLYESELHAVIETMIQRQPARVLNLGAAEGYYAVGMALRLPDSEVWAVDVSRGSEQVTQANAAANQVQVTTRCQRWTRQDLADWTRPGDAVIMDIEGGELDILWPDSVQGCHVLVESHENIHEHMTGVLVTRFGPDRVRVIRASLPDVFGIPELEHLSDHARMSLICDGRPRQGRWMEILP